MLSEDERQRIERAHRRLDTPPRDDSYTTFMRGVAYVLNHLLLGFWVIVGALILYGIARS